MGIEIMKHFPLKLPPRPGQDKALDFIERMVKDGVEDIIIEAPTGAGKSAMGAAACNWAANWSPIDMGEGQLTKPGGFYLVTQIGLQKQIIADVKANHVAHDFACLWSSSKYPCDGGKLDRNRVEQADFEAFDPPDDSRLSITCQMGLKNKKPACQGRLGKTCPYMIARGAFDQAIFSLTNYPWFLTERMFVGQLQPRNVMVLDECHTLERQLLKFGEIAISESLLREWDVRGLQVPEIEDMQQFANWLETRYLPHINERLGDYLSMAKALDDGMDSNLSKRITALENQVQKIVACVDGVRTKPDNWVYWYEQTDRDGNAAYCKPLDAAPYMDLIRSGAAVRIYMSAFPGEKHIFCESLGLDPDAVAWIRLASEFSKDNRPVIMGLVGSMSRRNQDTTLPALLRVVDKIMTQHAEEKGVIHCHSYELGQKILDYLKRTKHGSRILYPKRADERDELYKRHQHDPKPTVMLSPSMTEGYDFKFDEARWQIIAKVPYPYLGDRQIAAKKDRSQAWYDLQTVMSIVQASGRVCRDATDYGVTYVLDSDFKSLWDKRRDMFPKWFQEAIVWT
jgi:ATP-dependent DNA helicase DinG